MKNKKTGVYYTPPVLADYLVKPLVTSSNQKILDPSYGEGALLLAAERIIENNSKYANVNLYGCDIQPVNGLLKHLPEANLIEIDFFDFSSEHLFQTILMNPPYVRHQIQNLTKIKKYRAKIPQLSILNNNADLWAYFLVKAVSHLQQNGSIGAILPWAFLQADYARKMRKWLAESFNEIKVVALSNKYFEKADERIVVLWLEGYGNNCRSIKIASSKNIESKIDFTELPLQNWYSEKVCYIGINDIEQIFSRYKSEFGFTKFFNHADIRIGVVTGAVDYFIMSKNTAKENKFKSNRLIPILSRSNELPKYLKHGKAELRVLIALRKEDHLNYPEFVNRGIEDKIHLRSHSTLREPWYSVKVGNIPDAFFHYRISKIPYLLPNNKKVQCTNSIHRVYFKKLTAVEKKWIIVSMLSTPSQLSVEANSKTYGRGVLKIEPSSLKNTLVLKRNDSSINQTYKKIISLLCDDNKEEAMQVASEFINKKLKIPVDLQRSTDKAISTYQQLRLI